jgi:hypothetical protein
MDGHEYVSAFRLPEHPDYTVEEMIAQQKVNEVINNGLADMVVALYLDGHIDSLADRPPSPVVVTADGALLDMAESVRRFRHNHRQETANLRSSMPPPGARSLPRRPVDETHTLPEKALSDISEIDKNTIHFNLVGYSWKLVNSAISKINRRAAKGPLTEEKVAREIKDVTTNERRILGNALNGYRGVIAIENDYDSTGKLQLEDVVDMRVKVTRPHDRHTPNWMHHADEWGDHLGLLCSAITEAEALLVLQEWVMARNLPYLPIAAPDDFERGRLRDPLEPSFRADILLCSMIPGRNEIIPVQVKNYVDQGMYAQYSPHVVLVSPRHLGMERAEKCVITVGSRQRLGTRLITTYGNIMERYFIVHPFGKGKSGPVSKVDKLAYAAALQPGFEYFDREIGARIAQYTKEIEAQGTHQASLNINAT